MDEQGLPRPGRELDAWICEHIMGWHRLRYIDLYSSFSGDFKNAYVHYDQSHLDYCQVFRHGKRVAWQPSTSSAFFQVMEVMMEMGYFVDLYWHMNGLFVRLRQLDEGTDPDTVIWQHTFGGLKAVQLEAWAVCCCAWKAKGGEDAT